MSRCCCVRGGELRTRESRSPTAGTSVQWEAYHPAAAAREFILPIFVIIRRLMNEINDA